MTGDRPSDAKDKRPPWGHVSRHCVNCGKVGPRCVTAFGYSHYYCLTPSEKRARRSK